MCRKVRLVRRVRMNILPNPRHSGEWVSCKVDAPRSQVLNSWKEIAGYMKVGIRTVQRYESEFGMPVRRFDGKNRSLVWAYPDELCTWLHHRAKPSERRESPETCVVDLASLGTIVAKVQESILENARLRKESQALRSALREAMASLQDSVDRLNYRCAA